MGDVKKNTWTNKRKLSATKAENGENALTVLFVSFKIFDSDIFAELSSWLRTLPQCGLQLEVLRWCSMPILEIPYHIHT